MLLIDLVGPHNMAYSVSACPPVTALCITSLANHTAPVESTLFD